VACKDEVSGDGEAVGLSFFCLWGDVQRKKSAFCVSFDGPRERGWDHIFCQTGNQKMPDRSSKNHACTNQTEYIGVSLNGDSPNLMGYNAKSY
jgi:hypothetical protein